MHKFGDGNMEVYRPSTRRWLQLPPRTPIYAEGWEGTLIYRHCSLRDAKCMEIGILIRRLHHRLATFSHNEFTDVPARYLVDPDDIVDYDLINTLDELVY
jgi:hypothetical protein